MKSITLIVAFCTLTFFAFSQGNNRPVAFNYGSIFKAYPDTQFDKGSAITSIPLDPRRIND
ncbi:MAG TPA: hypothetical protein VF008_08115 [Niastella sp.]